MRQARIGFSGQLADATFRFETDAPDLAAYARAHLGLLATTETAAPTIRATLRWHDAQPPAQRPPDVAQMPRVDRDIYCDGERLHWFRVDDLRDLFLHFTWQDDHLVVEGDFYHRLGNRPLTDRLRRVQNWSRRDALRRRRFTTLLAYLVYYPCWWWLEQTRDLHPIHAAGVATDAGVIVLAGASGVGKSTLAVALAGAPGARLLSDSFVLHNGLDVRAVREPILLDAWSRRWLGPTAAALQPIVGHFVLNRHGYQMPPRRAADAGRAALLLFPRRTREPSVQRLSAARAHQRLSAADLIINDLRRYWAFAAVLEQLAPAGLVARREAQLAKLTATIPCYEIGVTADTTSAAITDQIMRLLSDQPLRVAGGRQ
ncbi:MAG: hypothetical protein ACHQ4J_10995 [Candidatus Binatia bacterium]